MGIRLARILHGLLTRPHGWSFGAIQDEIGISERTLLRYIAACREELVDAEGHPLLEVVPRGDHRSLRLTDSARTLESTAYQALSFYFALSVFQFLEGTILKEGVQDLWERFRRTLPAGQQGRLADFAKKFYSIPYAMKDYRGCDDVLDVVVRCLVHQHTMRVEYAGLWSGQQTQDFDPYTLAMYRGGLYLIGRSHQQKKIVYLAIERIRKAERLAAHFEYPKGYSPQKHTEGTFGIVDGPEERVEILILDPDTTALLSSRRLHPTQKFESRGDGTTLLSMKVRGTRELKNWILGLGPHAKVLAPAELRDEVRAAHRESAGLYADSP
jgi:predicted DNA-binding transcriptional regulator YafY